MNSESEAEAELYAKGGAVKFQYCIGLTYDLGESRIMGVHNQRMSSHKAYIQDSNELAELTLDDYRIYYPSHNTSLNEAFVTNNFFGNDFDPDDINMSLIFSNLEDQ